jgi:hypothetical protein
MGSAGLKYGQVVWDDIWDNYWDLAMVGGPHKGKLLMAA